MDMTIEIIGTESLGVRGLCCFVITGKHRIVIDPGVALGLIRHGLLPHPVQIAEGERVRKRIVEVLTEATDVVLSHFHGDHIPLQDANPYQLAIHQLPQNFSRIPCWSKSRDGLRDIMHKRAQDLQDISGAHFHVAEGCSEGPMTFSKAVPHGTKRSGQGTVMMTSISANGTVFLHTSDIQLLDFDTVDYIIDCKPDIVLAGGPPLYLKRLTNELRAVAWENSLRLAKNVDTLIIDHHLMRDEQGPAWLEELSVKSGTKVYCSADFMGRKRLLYEAERTKLYQAIPVAPCWHKKYAKGLNSTAEYISQHAFYP